MDELRKITTELAKIDEGKVKAIADGERVYLMIQDAPAELRRLADALEKIDVREIKALVAYAKPGVAGGAAQKKLSARSQKMLETMARSPLEARVEEALARGRSKWKNLRLTGVKDGVAQFTATGDSDLAQLRDDLEELLEKDVPEVKKVEVRSG